MEHQTLGRKSFLKMLGGSAIALAVLARLRGGEEAGGGGRGGGQARLETRADPRAVARDVIL
jgi:hypothetical protein